MKVMLWIIGVPVGMFGVLFLFFLVKEIANPTSVIERINDSCKKEFGNRGEQAILDCQLRLSLRYLADQESAKDAAAYGRVR